MARIKANKDALLFLGGIAAACVGKYVLNSNTFKNVAVGTVKGAIKAKRALGDAYECTKECAEDIYAEAVYEVELEDEAFADEYEFDDEDETVAEEIVAEIAEAESVEE